MATKRDTARGGALKPDAKSKAGAKQSVAHALDLPRHFTVLAPMEGVTDAVFRQVVAKAGRPDLFFTEFTNVSSYASEKGRANALERLQVVPSDPPIIAQIWGKNPEHFAATAAALADLGFAGLDINMGCPDRHVCKAGGGSAMIRTPELALECLAQARAETPLPISVKTRLGYSQVDEWRDWLGLLLRQNLSMLTVHLRTKKEMSKVPAHYELIPEILALRARLAPATRLVFNGDIADLAAAEALWQQYPEIDGLMIGRGVFANPYCFTHYTPTREDLLRLLNLHLDLHEAASARSARSFEPLKRFFKIYVRDWPGASDLRVRLMECHNTAEARATLISSSQIGQ